MDFKVQPSRCLRCQKVNDGASNPSSKVGPRDGDVSVCVYCSAVMAFTSSGSVRPFKEGEMRRMLADERFMRELKHLVGVIQFVREREGDDEVRMN